MNDNDHSSRRTARTLSAIKAVASSPKVALRRLAFAGVALLVIALVALSIVQVVRVRSLHDDQDQRAAAMRAASHQVVLLTTVSAATSASDLNAMLAGATQGFRDQFSKDANAFFETMKAERVVSKGSVDSIGLTSFSKKHAEALVAAAGTVQNSSTTTPEVRVYRLQVLLDRVGGKWLVSGMRFVV